MKKFKLVLVIVSLLTVGLSFNSCKKDNAEPELSAGLSMDGHNRPAPTTVHFTNESENADSYLWDFGDGETSEEINPTHEYTEPGNYSVELEARNEAGETKTATGLLKIYGTLTGWEVDAVLADEDIMADVPAGSFVYLILLDNNGNYINYTGSSGQVRGFETNGDGSKEEWLVRTYDGAPVIVGMNGAVTVKILRSGSTSVDPNNDELLAETTINTQNDLVPANNLDPYPFAHFSNNNNLQVDVDWVEEE
jgi:PKD repeat protein